MKSESLKGVDIAIVSTVPFFLVNQLSSHIYNLKEKGMNITLITSMGPELQGFLNDDLIEVVPVEIPRKIHPWADLKALYILYKLFANKKFTIMHSTTPKAGLLCAIAAKVTAVPIRLHTFTGQVWATKTGLMRALLQFLDKIIVAFNSHCYTDSPSQQQYLVDSGIAQKEQISTYGRGSLAGVDLSRFSPQRFNEDFKVKLRESLNIKEGVFVLIFIGRLIKDKGIYELLEAFEAMLENNKNVNLIILGPMEERDNAFLLNIIHKLPEIHWLGNVEEPEQYLSITDILCLPSYREGFGTVVIEAAAMGVPTIGTEIPGLIDAIEDGVTGVLVPKQNVEKYSQSLKALLENQDLLQKMKVSARKNCELHFDSKIVNLHVEEEYLKWLDLLN